MEYWQGENEKKGYAIGANKKGELFIKCLTCTKESYNHYDIRERYCGFCHKFHEDEDPAKHMEGGSSSDNNEGASKL